MNKFGKPRAVRLPLSDDLRVDAIAARLGTTASDIIRRAAVKEIRALERARPDEGENDRKVA